MFKLNGIRFDERELAVLKSLCKSFQGQTKGDVRRFRSESALSHNEWSRFENKLFEAKLNDSRTGSWFSVKINPIVDAIEKLSETAQHSTLREEEMASDISVFISHSSQDKPLAKALANLIQSALAIPHAEIRCTSVEGYKLPAGADVNHQLREEVVEAQSLIALITDVSIESAFVLFEMGARWGTKKYFVPLMAAGATSAQLKGPLGGLNALSCVENDIHQLLGDLGRQLDREVANPGAYIESLSELVTQSQNLKKTRPEQKGARNKQST